MIRTVLLSVLSFGVVVAAQAQVWRPDKPIEIVVPTTPGGGIDAAEEAYRIAASGTLPQALRGLVNWS